MNMEWRYDLFLGYAMGVYFFAVYFVFGKGIVHKIVVVVCRYAGCNMYGNCVKNMYVFTI